MNAFTSERSDPNGDICITQAGGSHPRRLTADPVLDESPDSQPSPFSVGAADRGPAQACGDLSLLPGGVASIAAERWSPDDGKVEGLDCTGAWHSFDQQLVECQHRGDQKGIASVWRKPAS